MLECTLPILAQGRDGRKSSMGKSRVDAALGQPGFGPLLGLFKPLVEAGGDVRVFNPPSLGSVLGWTRRNHRKVITIDSRVSYISGLCMGQMWEGYPDRKLAPWRDTGMEVIGPAVAAVEQAFADSWEMTGGQLDRTTLPRADDIDEAGTVALRIVPTEPFTAKMFQLDVMAIHIRMPIPTWRT